MNIRLYLPGLLCIFIVVSIHSSDFNKYICKGPEYTQLKFENTLDTCSILNDEIASVAFENDQFLRDMIVISLKNSAVVRSHPRLGFFRYMSADKSLLVTKYVDKEKFGCWESRHEQASGGVTIQYAQGYKVHDHAELSENIKKRNKNYTI